VGRTHPVISHSPGEAGKDPNLAANYTSRSRHSVFKLLEQMILQRIDPAVVDVLSVD